MERKTGLSPQTANTFAVLTTSRSYLITGPSLEFPGVSAGSGTFTEMVGIHGRCSAVLGSSISPQTPDQRPAWGRVPGAGTATTMHNCKFVAAAHIPQTPGPGPQDTHRHRQCTTKVAGVFHRFVIAKKLLPLRT